MKFDVFRKQNINKLLEKVIFIGLLCLIVVIFSQQIELTAVDLGRHIQNGKVVWQNPDVLFTNFYSYTEPTFRFINHHWLSGVIYYLTYSIGGFAALTLLNIIFILGTFCLAFKMVRQRINFPLTALLSIPVIFLLAERVEIRPEIFSYFLFFLTWWVIEQVDYSKNYRHLRWLMPIFLLWVNLHIYFFLGLILVGFKLASKFLPAFIKKTGGFRARIISAWKGSKVWGLNFLALVIVCLFNPNIIGGLLYPFNIFKNYGYVIAENKSIFFLENLMINFNYSLFKLLLFVLILSWAAYFVFRKKVKWFELGVSLLFMVMALLFSRNLAIFGLVAWVLISTNLSPIIKYLKHTTPWFRTRSLGYNKELVSVGLILLIIISGTYLLIDARSSNRTIKNSLGWSLNSGNNDSIKFFKDNNLSGPIFNNYDIGSALIFGLYPQEKVFVDNRPEAYSNTFFEEVYRPMQEDEVVWLEDSVKYNINLIYFSHTDSTPWAKEFLYRRLKDSHWSLIYFDRYTVIMVADTKENKDIIDKLHIDDQEFKTRIRDLAKNSNLKSKFYLAGLAILNNRPELAEEIYRSILFRYPSNARALYSLGSLYANTPDRTAWLNSIDYFKRALINGYRLPAVYNQIGLVYWQLEDYQNAENSWKKTLKLDKKNNGAHDYLEQIRKLKLGGRLP